jgi:hypothetical protein
VVVAADEEPPLPSNGNSPEFTFRAIVLKDQPPVLEHAHERVLLADGVAEGGAEEPALVAHAPVAG